MRSAMRRRRSMRACISGASSAHRLTRSLEPAAILRREVRHRFEHNRDEIDDDQHDTEGPTIRLVRSPTTPWSRISWRRIRNSLAERALRARFLIDN